MQTNSGKKLKDPKLPIKQRTIDHSPLEGMPKPYCDYFDAVQGKGPLAYDWKDKPHRLIYDLLLLVKANPPAVARAESAVVRAAERWSKITNPFDDVDETSAAIEGLQRAVERLQAARKKGARG